VKLASNSFLTQLNKISISGSCSSRSTSQPTCKRNCGKVDLGTTRTGRDFYSIWTHYACTRLYTSGHERAQAFLAPGNKVRPTMTYCYRDRPWELVGGQATGCVIMKTTIVHPQAVKTSAQQVCEMMSGASEALLGPWRSPPKRYQESSKTGLAVPGSAVIKQICPTVYISRPAQL
jgi:hypothetical protein